MTCMLLSMIYNAISVDNYIIDMPCSYSFVFVFKCFMFVEIVGYLIDWFMYAI